MTEEQEEVATVASTYGHSSPSYTLLIVNPSGYRSGDFNAFSCAAAVT